MILTATQKAWLTKLVNHEHKGYWLSLMHGEDKKVMNILKAGSYTDIEQTFLQDIVEYYKQHIDKLGTLNNPM